MAKIVHYVVEMNMRIRSATLPTRDSWPAPPRWRWEARRASTWPRGLRAALLGVSVASPSRRLAKSAVSFIESLLRAAESLLMAILFISQITVRNVYIWESIRIGEQRREIDWLYVIFCKYLTVMFHLCVRVQLVTPNKLEILSPILFQTESPIRDKC